jgi:hypothetical protein
MSIPPNFNWRFYLENNHDLRNAGLSTENDAITHYTHFGHKENRKYCVELPVHFDWRFYLDTYQDLRDAGFTNEHDAITHYLLFGYKEHRRYSPLIPSDFNWKIYIKNYIDLRHNGGIINSQQAFNHYIYHGRHEGRIYDKIISERKAVLCTMVKCENLYMDEWIQYHLKLGFSKIIIYDNNDNNEAQYFQDKYDQVQVIHYPGNYVQVSIHTHFLKSMSEIREYEWGGIIDLDEFIVLKKHKNIIELLMEHCQEGSLGLSWVIFGSSGEKEYRPEPVLKRFIQRSKYVNHHIKSLFCLDDVSGITNSHFVHLRNGNQHDCHGHVFNGPFNIAHASDDIACVHHYFSKSWGEYLDKARRGESDTPMLNSPKYTKHCFDRHDDNDIEDTSAWDFFNSSS